MAFVMSPTYMAVASAVVLVLFAVVLWAAVLAFRALVRFGRSAEETAEQIETLTKRLDAIADLAKRKPPKDQSR